MNQYHNLSGQSLKNNIGKSLTLEQRQKVIIAVQILKCDVRISDPERLTNEIVAVLLDPNRYVDAGGNFSVKLKMISNSIRERIWKPYQPHPNDTCNAQFSA